MARPALEGEILQKRKVKEDIFIHFKETLNSYYELSESSFEALCLIAKEKKVKKGSILIDLGEIPLKFYFLHKGLFRAYAISDDSSREVNKSFFMEGRFPSSVIAALDKVPSDICIESLEDSILLEINHDGYRKLLNEYEDLKWFHIRYLEQHWVREKEPDVFSLLGGDAKKRYLDFEKNNPEMMSRVPLFHLASRIGITPTQLSRIRKSLKS